MDSLNQHRSSGVALLEAMLALALFGITVVSLVGVLRNMSLLTVESSRRAHALNHAQSLLEAELRSYQVIEGVTRTGPDDLGISYEVRVEPHLELVNQTGSTLPGMYRILVIATWREGAQIETLEAETLRNALLYR